jgi:hypothetical protein
VPPGQRPVPTRSGRVAPLGNRGITGRTLLPHAYRSGATSVVGTQRRGIHRLLILSCRSYDCRSLRRLPSVLGRPTGTTPLSPKMKLVRYKHSLRCLGAPRPNRAQSASSICVALEATPVPRKEVIQPQLPLRLPCYDFVPVANPALGHCPPCGLARGLHALPTPMT